MADLNLENIDLGSFGINEEKETQLNATMSEAVKVNPDQHAQTVKLSQASGVPEFAVQSNPEQVEHKLKLDQINLEGMTTRAPKTSNFLTSNVNNAVIAQEDVTAGLLEGIEKTFDGLGGAISVGFQTQYKGFKLKGIEDTLKQFEPQQGLLGLDVDPDLMYALSDDYNPDLTREEFITAKEEAANRLVGEIQELQKERQDLTPEDMNIVQEGVRAGVESIANMLPGIGLTVLSRGRTAPLLFTVGAQTYAGSYGDSRAEGLTPEEAQWYAGIDAAIEVGTELLPTGTLETIITGQSKGLKKDALKFVVREMGTEQLATALQTVNSYMFGLDKELENATSAQEIVEIQMRRQAVTAIATIVAGGTQITAATAVNKTLEKLSQTEQQAETQASVEQSNIDKLSADSVKSKLRERDVESFKQFVREADGENNTNVFIDGVQTALYLQGKTREEIDADPALKVLDNAVRESRATGADVAIPVDQFMGDVAGTEAFTQLRDHMTMSEETVSPFRQEQHKVETQNYVKSLLDEATENASEYVEAQEIYTQVRDQLVDTGVVSPANASTMAQIVPAWATAQARRTGRTVQEVYESAGLVIEGPQTGELARLEGEQKQQEEPTKLHNVPESLIIEFPDFLLTDQGVIPLSNLKEDEQVALIEAGVVETLQDAEGNDYEGVNPQHLWDERKTRQDRIQSKQKPKQTVKEWNEEAERLAQQYDRKAEREESEGVFADEELIKAYRDRAAQIRAGKRSEQVTDEPNDLAPGKPLRYENDLLRQEKPDTDAARGYYDPENSIIRLTESADLSTFLHEFSHFMYEMELQSGTELGASINNWFTRNSKEVAAEATKYLNGQFDQMKQGERTTDDKTINEASVVNYLETGTTGNTDKDAAIRRATHEQFARGFETYLMEGKAPSIELRNAFRTFARWLSQIYQALRGQLNVKLDNEMRQVFDRLLATEEQIAAAESRARVEPMFTDAAMAGMTTEEFADYQKRQGKVKDVQSETLRDKLMASLTRKTKQWWKEEKADLIDEEMSRLSGEKVYATAARLRDGDIKLDHATVKEMVGEEKTDKLGRTSTRIPDKLRGMTAKGQKGIHPDEAAAFLGYDSGSQMLNDLIVAPPIKETAEANAEAAMIERHGDPFTDGTIEQLANEAVMNEERGKLILHELKVLARGTNQQTLDRQTMKSVAEERIGQLSFREIHPGKYRKAEIRAAQESARMLAEGNKEGAAQAKQRQALNYYLGMAATEAKNETTKIVDRMARYNKKKVREEIQKAEGGYWEQITKILERFEFRKSASLKQVDEVNQDINSWMRERVDVDGDGLVLHNAVLNESYVTHWKNVAYSDLQGIDDSVKNIEHVARYANKLTRMGEEIEFNKLVDRWTTSMDENVETRFKSKRTDVVEGKKWGRWFMAQMTKIPFMASWLDGGERVGISHQVLVQPFTDAYNAEIKLWDEAGKPVMEAIEGRDKETIKRHNRKIYIPEIDDNLYGHQILAVALNTGNEGNLRKLLLGEKWANPDNDAEITLQNRKLQAVLSHMTESDWKMVQMIWDQMDTLYPQLAEVHRRTTGLVPPKVEATPVETQFGTFKGGYYPVKYDPNRSHRAAQNEDKLNAETESMFSNNSSIQSSVNTGSTNERTGFYDAIRLSLDVVPAHFQEAIHYVTHHDPVREVNRLIRDQRVASTIKEKLGPEEYAQLRPWLNDIAKDGREAPTKMFWDDILQRLRFGVTLGAMGFKASTGIIQISGLSNALAEVGTANTMQAMRSILGSTTTMKQAWDFAVENSKVMEHRAQTMDREIKNAMKRIEGKRGLMAAVQEASMKHIALIQTYLVDLPTWHASYIKGMKEWGDETRAFQYADWVVENVQGSGATKDLARIMRGQSETGRMFTMFMTFFSSLWNMERDLVKGGRSGAYSVTNLAAKSMFLFTIPVLFEMMMRGEFDKEDETEEEKLQRMLTAVAMYPVQSVPFVRDIANAVTGDFGYNISPMQSIIEQGTRTIPQLVEAGFTDEEITKGQAKGASKFIGATLGVPGTAQAWATGEHLYDVVAEGEELTMHQLLFGPERK
ncbi:coil containing protein [Vibrio phage 1.021.C._10N.222.51.F9]|nr:coil containing protein [Vibrio phage 1.021.A._10N.222.51.F9]AUR82131.1 coil containing protein [Vibrio phage 1.021.B._10N.222.51.F9]AUR82181.1 coil containing protein [Vibrio phage 1.021.C._10N.222.51.F9]